MFRASGELASGNRQRIQIAVFSKRNERTMSPFGAHHPSCPQGSLQFQCSMENLVKPKGVSELHFLSREFSSQTVASTASLFETKDSHSLLAQLRRRLHPMLRIISAISMSKFYTNIQHSDKWLSGIHPPVRLKTLRSVCLSRDVYVSNGSIEGTLR